MGKLATAVMVFATAHFTWLCISFLALEPKSTCISAKDMRTQVKIQVIVGMCKAALTPLCHCVFTSKCSALSASVGARLCKRRRHIHVSVSNILVLSRLSQRSTWKVLATASAARRHFWKTAAVWISSSSSFGTRTSLHTCIRYNRPLLPSAVSHIQNVVQMNQHLLRRVLMKRKWRRVSASPAECDFSFSSPVVYTFHSAEWSAVKSFQPQ